MSWSDVFNALAWVIYAGVVYLGCAWLNRMWIQRQCARGNHDYCLGFECVDCGAVSPDAPVAKCAGYADTSGGGHLALGDCVSCRRFSEDCGFPGDGDWWIERPARAVPCPQFVECRT